MATDDDNKTEEPTPKRVNKFREEGNIAQSRDIGGVAILAGALLLIIWVGPSSLGHLLHMTRQSFEALGQARGTGWSGQIMATTGDALKAMLWAVAPISATSLVLAVAAGVSQTGGNVSFKAMRFKAENFNIFASIKRILFSASTIQQILLAIAKATFLGVSLYLVLANALPELTQLAGLELTSGLRIVGETILKITLVALGGAALLAAVDYWLSYRRLHEQMKMTKQEVKDEHKQAEGDPQIKRQIRIRMMQLGQNRMLANVAKSDVVVVNPTHYAIALAYDPQVDDAPRLVAKGKDKVAAKIREIARKHQIPIVANPPVARAIFAGAEVGEAIPAELYEMVAKVLAYLYRITGKAAA